MNSDSSASFEYLTTTYQSSLKGQSDCIEAHRNSVESDCEQERSPEGRKGPLYKSDAPCR